MSSIKKTVTVVILTYNSQAYIKQCLKSLKNEASLIKEIILVDNDSKDKTLEVVKKSSIDTTLIVNTKNLGFSKGINTGIRLAKSKNILILNPDTIVSRGAIQQLLLCQKKTDADIIGGRSTKRNGQIHNTFVRMPDVLTIVFDFTNLRKIFPFDYVHKHHYYLDKNYPVDPKNVDAVSGAFMLVNKKVFEKIGEFDENFFMYLEDVDFCIRARQSGFKVFFCPKSTIFHEGGASSRNVDKINHKAWSNSRKYYSQKHFSKVANILTHPIFLLDDLLINLWRKLKSR